MPLQEASIPPLGEQRFDQNWANRSLLGAGFQKTGRGKRRKYSLEDCLVLALTLRLRNAGFSASEAFECVSKQWSQKASLATLAYNAVHQLVRAGRVWPVVLVEITNFQEPTAGLTEHPYA